MAFGMDDGVWYNGCMTNNNDAPGDIIVSGTHFANALAFIVESLADAEEGTGMFNTTDLENLDKESLLEFADMYNFTESTFENALKMFCSAVDQEVHNAFYNGDCRNCMENPPTFN